MHAQVKQPQRRLAIVVMGICLVLEACGQATLPVLTPLPALQSCPRDLPGFLSRIYPPQDIAVLQRSVSTTNITWAVLELDEIAEPGETLSQQEMQSRVEFSIDGELRDIEIMIPYLNTPTQAAVIGKFALSVGEHKATIRVHRTSGQVLEYSWAFSVWVEEPTVPGLPEWLQFVRPLPDSIITVQEYREDRLLPAYYPFGFADLREGVCVGIQTGKIVELGENLDCSGVLRKLSFVTLDSTPFLSFSPGQYSGIIEGGCELALHTTTDEKGQIIRSYPGPHAYLCWRVKLTPGKHEITVQLERASGEVLEYTWRFTITDD